MKSDNMIPISPSFRCHDWALKSFDGIFCMGIQLDACSKFGTLPVGHYLCDNTDRLLAAYVRARMRLTALRNRPGLGGFGYP
jgi:hypothetical protein